MSVTSEDQTRLRIDIANEIGYESITQSQDGTWYGYFRGARLKSPLPDPFNNAADCEALLVDTISRASERDWQFSMGHGSKSWWAEFWDADTEEKVAEAFASFNNPELGLGHHLIFAYREATAKVCLEVLRKLKALPETDERSLDDADATRTAETSAQHREM